MYDMIAALMGGCLAWSWERFGEYRRNVAKVR